MKLPPLNALRAFEVAARHGSFAIAADELNVSRGAVSRHIRLLEETTGLALFHRHPNGVDLTATGAALLPVLSESFSRIASEIEQLRKSGDELRVICPPATAIRWLIPRLSEFQKDYPQFPVSLTVDFHTSDPFDGIRHDLCLSLLETPFVVSGLARRALFPSLISPVCSPDLAIALERPSDLSRQKIIHENPYVRDWFAWIEHFGVSDVDPTSGDIYPNLDNAIKGAMTGQGVVMADITLCRDELEQGGLVMPFPNMVCASEMGDICVLMSEARANEPPISTFVDWLLAKGEQTQHDLKARGFG